MEHAEFLDSGSAAYVLAPPAMGKVAAEASCHRRRIDATMIIIRMGQTSQAAMLRFLPDPA